MEKVAGAKASGIIQPQPSSVAEPAGGLAATDHDCGSPLTAGEQLTGENEAAADVREADDQRSFDIPRPFLTLSQAAAILGKSLRAIERAILGRWGNKLPDGWQAKKIPTERGYEWRIIPPPGFRVRQLPAESQEPGPAFDDDLFDEAGQAHVAHTPAAVTREKRRTSWGAHGQTLEHPTVVIDRSEEVEYLLRELIQAQKQLAEERRLRMEDLRLITQMQGSMRLLESRASETAKLKEELEAARKEFLGLKDDYLRLLNLPWWKRIFRYSR